MDVVRIGDRPVGAGRPGIHHRGGGLQPRSGPRPGAPADRRRRRGGRRRGQVPDVPRRRGSCAETPTRAEYLDGILPPGQTMSELFRAARAAARMARDARRGTPTERGLDFLSTPFDHEAVDLLDELGVKAFKVATYELWHLPLIRDIASRGKPIICSTGMANMADVQAAVDVGPRDRQRAADPAPLRRQLPAAVLRPQPARHRDDAPGLWRAGRLERPHPWLAGTGRGDQPSAPP